MSFSSILNILRPFFSNRYLRDLKLLGKIVHGARNTYRDEQLNIIDAGEKVKKLIQQHLYALRNDVLKLITSGKVSENLE